MPKSASRLFDGIGTSIRPSARQALFPCVVSPSSLTTLRFRTFTPFLAPAMLPFRLLAPSFPRLHHLQRQTAILSSHEWSDSRTRRAPICTLKGSLSASMSLYVFLERFSCSHYKASLVFLVVESDHGCFGSPLHYQEQSILPD